MEAAQTVRTGLTPHSLADTEWEKDTVGCELPGFCDATITYVGKEPVQATHLLIAKTGRVALANMEQNRAAFWLSSDQLKFQRADHANVFVNFNEETQGANKLAFSKDGNVVFRTWMSAIELRDVQSPVKQPSNFNPWYAVIGLLAVVALGLVAHKNNLLPFGSCAAR